jgi:hypothetical protein
LESTASETALLQPFEAQPNMPFIRSKKNALYVPIFNKAGSLIPRQKCRWIQSNASRKKITKSLGHQFYNDADVIVQNATV